MQDYGRASFDTRNRFFLGGSIGLPWGFRVSPFLIASSGSPYNVTLSQDLIGSSQLNQRPAFASNLSSCGERGDRAGIRQFRHDSMPARNSLIPVNYLTGPGPFHAERETGEDI